jgi:hypothetical protein
MVAEKQTLLSFPKTETGSGWLTPISVFILLFLLSIGFYFLKNKTPSLIFDIIFFSMMGLFGLLITYLWLGRVDEVCRNNINILWALPTHLIAVFFIRKKTAWIKYYFLITAILAAFLLIGFPWWPQKMNMAVVPILGIIIFRSFNLFQNRNHAEKAIVQG